MRRHLIWLTAAPFTTSRLAKYGWVPFAVYNTWQRSRTHTLRRVGKNSGTVLTAVCYRGLPLPCGKVWLSPVV